MVFVDHDENKTLKKDLSNTYGLVVDAFIHLALDSLNRKWFTEDESLYKTTAVFGKSFSSLGNKKIRGYVLEYYDQDPHTLVDSIPDRVEVKR